MSDFIHLVHPFTLDEIKFSKNNPHHFYPCQAGVPAGGISIEDFSLEVSDSIVEVRHATLPAWSLLTLSKESICQLLLAYFLEPEELAALVYPQSNKPILFGNVLSLTRLAEELPHDHRIFRMNAWIPLQERRKHE